MDSIFNYTVKDLEQIIEAQDYKKYSASQVFDWIYKKKVYDFSLMSNISKDLRVFLSSLFTFDFPEIEKKETSEDTTVKYLFNFRDSSKVEAVMMHQYYGNSLCVSSQVGCNMGCSFCASGLHKKARDLRASEMVAMLLKVEDDLNEKVTHVVIMGTGEPLDNLDNVLKFIEIINAPKGLEIGIRHITLSTSGIVPKIYELEEKDLQINLAISLHAPTNDLRNKLMPINKVYPVEDIIKAAKDYFDKTGRRITFEYLMLKGVNDSILYADKLADLIHGMNCYVNLIPYNHVAEFNYDATDEKIQNIFFNQLKKRGINVTLRKRMGSDISAACGQLRSDSIKKQNKQGR